MEKCRNPRAALVVPVDLTLPSEDGEDFLAFLELRLAVDEDGVWATTPTFDGAAFGVEDDDMEDACRLLLLLLLLLPWLVSVAEALLLLLGMGW